MRWSIDEPDPHLRALYDGQAGPIQKLKLDGQPASLGVSIRDAPDHSSSQLTSAIL